MKDGEPRASEGNVKRAVLLLSLLFALAPASAQDGTASPEVKEFLKAWAASMQNVKSLRVEFTQTKKLRIMRKPVVSSGTTLMKGKRVKMVVNGRDGKRETELLVEDGKVQIHYPRLKRLEIYPLTQPTKGSRSPFLLFGDDLESLPKTHKLTLEKKDGDDVLVLVPRDAKSTVKETRMRFKDHTVVSMTQLNKKGDKLVLQVHKFLKNVTVEDSALQLVTAKGTKVVNKFKTPK